MQIIYDRTNHWITASNFPKNDDVDEIHNSAPSKQLVHYLAASTIIDPTLVLYIA